jgi:glycosyltransferase involved in cell wall biosynthesis
MSNIKLSFILPCYNVEKYIVACLDSLYQQDIPEKEYEVICVNDCSPDGTRDIIVKYQKNHPNLVLIDHEVNKKQGGARNTGLKAAQGEYIWFVDPDDYIKPNVSGKLVNICSQNKLDVLIFNYEKVNVVGDLIFKSDFVIDSSIFNGIDYIYNQWGVGFLNKYDGSIWNRIHRKDFLLENNIIFPERIYWEDLEHSMRSILFSNRIKSISDSCYCYRTNPVSVMNTMFENMKTIFQSTVLLGKLIVSLSEDIKSLDHSLSTELRNGGIWRINQFTKPLIKSSRKEIINFFEILKKNKAVFMDLYPSLNRLNKIIVRYPILSKNLLLMSNPIIYQFLKIKK